MHPAHGRRWHEPRIEAGAMALGALLFDLDGTLVDSNGLHVEAWSKAFESAGYRVAADRIAIEIGKGGDHLVGEVLGAGAEKEHGDELRKSHDQAFAKLAAANAIGVAPRAVDLLQEAHRRGLALALATSAKEEDIERVERSSGVAWRTFFDVVVDAKKAKSSKPSPDIVEIAVAELGLTAAECAMVGDSEWDARAAIGAGVAMLGVTYGGNPRDVLFRAGARLVCRDTSAVLGDLDETLRRLSPGSATFDEVMLERLMEAALAEAEAGLREGEVPIGAVVARGDGEILGRAHNRCHEASCSIEHAETAALARALSAGLDPRLADVVLVSTLEPCVMCTGAAIEASAELMVHALGAPENGGTTRVRFRDDGLGQVPRVIGGVGAKESRALLERWLAGGDHRGDERFVRRLLEK